MVLKRRGYSNYAMMIKGKQVQYVSYYPPDLIKSLKKLKQKTRISISEHIREGVIMVIKKYERKHGWKLL